MPDGVHPSDLGYTRLLEPRVRGVLRMIEPAM